MATHHPVDDTAADQHEAPVEADGSDHGLVEDELLVEEVSIDGMCGVY